MSKVRVTLFEHQSKNVGVVKEFDSFREFYEVYKNHEYNPTMPKNFKTPHPSELFAPAIFTGGQRNLASVEHVTMAYVDIDKVPQEQFLETLKKLQAYEFWTYSTWSSGWYTSDRYTTKSGKKSPLHLTLMPEAERAACTRLVSARIVLALDQEVPAAQWPACWHGLNHKLAGIMDPQTKDASRMYYLPVAYEPSEHVFSGYNEGDGPLSYATLREAGGRAERSKKAIAGKQEADDTTVNVTLDDLRDFCTGLRRSKRGTIATQVVHALDAIIEGGVYAEYGERDKTLWMVCTELAAHFTTADVGSLAELFRRSLERTCEEFKDGDPEADIQKVCEKFTRARDEYEANKAKASEEQRRRVAGQIKDAFVAVGVDRNFPYTSEELAAYAANLGVDSDRLMKRLIIQQGKSYYVFFDGSYLPPVGKDALTLSAQRDLSPLCDVIELTVQTPSGEAPMPGETLANKYGTGARRASASLYAQKTYYDEREQKITEAVCPLRSLEPIYSPLAEEFLKQLAGEQYQKLEDWITTVTDLARASAVVYFSGAPSSGKSMLAKGLAKLWTSAGAPTHFGKAIANFNEDLCRCPLVLGDESIPHDIVNDTARMREFQQATTRSLNRKHLSHVDLEGAVRLILCANNENLLNTTENLSEDDVNAIAHRFLHIKVPQSCADWMLENNGTAVFAELVENEGLAKHALWLKKNRVERRAELFQNRFFVDGGSEETATRLAVSVGKRSHVCHWFINFLANRKPAERSGDHGVLVIDGAIHATPEAVYNLWDTYQAKDKNQPPLNQVADALKALSSETVELDHGKGPRAYYRIRTELLVAWSTLRAVGSVPELRRQLEVASSLVVAVPAEGEAAERVTDGGPTGGVANRKLFGLKGVKK